MLHKTLSTLTHYASILDLFLKNFSSDLVEFEGQVYAKFIGVSKEKTEIKPFAMLLNGLSIDINLDEFEGLL